MSFKTVSEFVKLAVGKIVKGHEEQGFFYYGRRVVAELIWDEKTSTNLLLSFMVRKDSVLRYLALKYIPTRTPNGARFLGQSCIQSVTITPNNKFFIHIKNSEPHKIITDTLHARSIMASYGYDLSLYPTILYKIDYLKGSKQDIPMYIECLKEWGSPVNSVTRRLQKMLLLQARGFAGILAITRASIKKKWLRYYYKIGLINYIELRGLVKDVPTRRIFCRIKAKKYQERARQMGLGRI
jgi:hypothetical protein